MPAVAYRRLTPDERRTAVLTATAEYRETGRHGAAAAALVEDTMCIGLRLAGRYQIPGHDHDDLGQEFALGCYDAIRRFRFRDGFNPGQAFTTTATNYAFRGRLSDLTAKRPFPALYDPTDPPPAPEPEGDPEPGSVSLYERVEALLRVLLPRDAEVIRRRFGIGCDAETLDQIGRRLGISKQRTQQIEIRAMRRLRQAAGRAQ